MHSFIKHGFLGLCCECVDVAGDTFILELFKY
jgi:hypothetical protein